ncbi:Arm DNA-binding domain-containing protein [Nitrosomonas ureae]|uniref:Integrase n=1 Tax=Nitrosomonas ureae TaxID=44577 RepID=A0A2T5ISZ5_9PROT|nr:DUF3596 domain-containing protein [Nitrosomonas ureae]PTQ86936.1 integrase [Nitrosomonas ureae]
MGGKYPGVRESSDSSIEIDFYYKGQRCRERLPIKPSPANLKKAAQHRAAILNAIDAGTFDYSFTFPNSKNAEKFKPDPIAGYGRTVSDALKVYIECARTSLAQSTWRDYRNSIMNHLIPSLGSINLRELTRADIKNFISYKTALDKDGNPAISKKRIHNILAPLRSVLQDAQADGALINNPLHGWKPKIVGKSQDIESIDPFTPQESALIIQHSEAMTAQVIQFGFWTGLRTGELIALKWIDVDFNSLEIIVRRTKVRKQIKETKTKAGTRRVKLIKPALEALEQMRLHSHLHESGFVFLNPRSRQPWLDDQQFRKIGWHPSIARSKVRYRYPYQMRHSYASVLLTIGEDYRWISKQLGHSNPNVTLKHYARFIPELAPDAGKKADKLWSSFGQHSIKYDNNSSG